MSPENYGHIAAHLSTCNTHTNSMLIVVCSNLYDELAQYNYYNRHEKVRLYK